MKKFLSMVLALVMTMSLVTVSAGAKDFTDSEKLSGERYEEAVNVMSEMGIIDGYADGSFQPQGTLTRGAAAKIIACMMLGKTTAEALGTQAAPFKDVPVGSTFAGYIAYCSESGIIDGYADGTFRPSNTLTGFAFLKMLLTALGYDSEIEGYANNPNWTVNVAGRAKQIGLVDGNENFVGTKAATREEACLYAVNALQATLVEYADKGTSITINGATISSSASSATYVTSNVYDQATSINSTTDNGTLWTVEFAEKYQPKLRLTPDTDAFERPSHTWSWDKKDIGTYLNYDELVAEYTTAVTGREVYDVLTATTIKECDVYNFVDGAEGIVDEDDLVRTNTDDLDSTGNGVLTQVFVDRNDNEIVITSINTWLAQATANYSESKEYAPLTAYMGMEDDRDLVTRTYNVDVEDVPEVADVEDETFYLVTISYKDDARNGEVVTIDGVEIMEDSTITKYSTSGSKVVSKVTTGGTEYKAAQKAFFDAEALDEYNESLLTDMTYNVYLDQYGYVIGLELYEGTLRYVFITGFDRPVSNLSVSTATAGAIFLDGTMDEIKVNVKDTNENIGDADPYYVDWTPAMEGYDDGVATLNRWYTYTVDENGVYTLKPTHMTATLYAEPNDDVDPDGFEEVTIDTSNVRVDDTVLGEGTRVYGEDASVFITVDTDVVDTTDDLEIAITDVDGVYTGVQNVDLEIDVSNMTIFGQDEYKDGFDPDDPYTAPNDAIIEGQVYTVYDSDNYIIGAIVMADATGSIANIAYILDDEAQSEEYKDGVYYWEFDVVMNGEVQTLTAKSRYTRVFDAIADAAGDFLELRFDGDNYVVDTKEIEAADRYVDYTVNTDGEDVYVIAGLTPDENIISLQGNTLYLTPDTTAAEDKDVGLAIARDAKAVVIQDENRDDDVVTEFDSVSAARNHLADPDPETSALEYEGRVLAVLNSNGTAAWVVFDSETPLVTGANVPDAGDDTTTAGRTTITIAEDSDAAFRARDVLTRLNAANALEVALPLDGADGTVLASASVAVKVNGFNVAATATEIVGDQYIVTFGGREVSDTDTVEITIDDCVYGTTEASLTSVECEVFDAASDDLTNATGEVAGNIVTVTIEGSAGEGDTITVTADEFAGGNATSAVLSYTDGAWSTGTIVVTATDGRTTATYTVQVA